MKDLRKSVVVIIVMSLLGLCIWGFIHSCSQLNNEISKHGLKNIIEQIWEGDSAKQKPKRLHQK